jgi:CMP/dCMP kinase
MAGSRLQDASHSAYWAYSRPHEADRMIVTLDGPAGAGKSSTARMLAKRLGFRFLDTGAMYRAIALAAARRNLPWDQPEALVELSRQVRLEISETQVLIDGEDVTDAIRTSQITSLTHYAADNPGVREELVKLQQQAAGSGNIVTEGRDQGTIVFPNAECKIFLTASPEERARRRKQDLAARGEHVELDEILASQNRRDERDTSREVGPLVAASDSIEVLTDGLTREQVVDRLEAIVRSKMQS